ncbi:hypothetical protein ACOME3_005360 [Neoechinorhynchus agilis]
MRKETIVRLYTVTRDQVKLLIRQRDQIAQETENVTDSLQKERHRILECYEQNEKLREQVVKLTTKLSEIIEEADEAEKRLVELSSNAGKSEYARKMFEQQQYQYEEHIDELREKIDKLKSNQAKSALEYTEIETKYKKTNELLMKRKEQLFDSEKRLEEMKKVLMQNQKIEEYWTMINFCREWEIKKEEAYEKKTKRIMDALSFVENQTFQSYVEQEKALEQIEFLKGLMVEQQIYSEDVKCLIKSCMDEINHDFMNL